MSYFEELNALITPPEEKAMAAARQRWDEMAKPAGSLGLLEDALVTMAGVTGSADMALSPRRLVVFCADNGVLAQGVAQTPGEITAVMTELIAAGRSSVGIMARQAKAELVTVDMGVARPVSAPGIVDRRVAAGTGDFTQGPAMTRRQAQAAVETGLDLARQAAEEGIRLLITGEMGIGNTTTASAVASVLLGQDPRVMTGRGAGLSDEGLTRKAAAIQAGIRVNRPDPTDALDVLAKLGGFDIAGMCGLFLGGARYRLPVLIDGVISAVAALVALRLCPACRKALVATHVSAEPAAAAILEALGLRAPLHGGLRLGEGTGALAFLPVLDMAAAVYRELATLQDIGLAP